MPKLTYTSKNFPVGLVPNPNGDDTIDVDWAEMVWAAITVGKPEGSYLFMHGILSWYELSMRMYMLYVNFKESWFPISEFEQTQVYKALDPSEKTSISYFMGLTTAKLLTNRFLGVTWLIHLDNFKKIHALKKTKLKFSSKKRPDLLGLNKRRGWLVMEAKGRSGKLPKGLIGKALLQTGALNTIDSKTPFLRVACASYAIADILFAHWECPKKIDIHDVHLGLTDTEFLNHYYTPIRSLIYRDNQDESREAKSSITYFLDKAPAGEDKKVFEENRVLRFDTVSISELDITIGLLDRPNNFFLENISWHEDLLRSEQFLGQASNFRGRLFIASDGVLVQLGPTWHSDNMEWEPNERSAQGRSEIE